MIVMFLKDLKNESIGLEFYSGKKYECFYADDFILVNYYNSDLYEKISKTQQGKLFEIVSCDNCQYYKQPHCLLSPYISSSINCVANYYNAWKFNTLKKETKPKKEKE
jgi:hypothetical protein